MDPAADESLDRRWLVNPHAHVIQCSDDEVLVKHGASSLYSEIIVDEQRTRLLGRVLRGMRAPASVRDLLQRGLIVDGQRGMAAEVVSYLAAHHVLVDPELDLQSLYVDTVLRRNDGASVPLQARTVGLIGAGPVGSQVAASLAPFAPKRLMVVDGRAPAPPAGALGDPPSEDGVSNAEQLRLRLDRNGFDAVEVVEGGPGQEQLDRLLAEADFVAVAWESFAPTLLHDTNDAAIRHRTPWLAAFLDGSQAVVSPVFVPVESACYYEFEIQAEAALLMKDEYLLYKEHIKELAGPPPSVPPPYVQVAAGLAATAALRYLVNDRGTTTRTVQVDFERLSVSHHEILKLPRCPACTRERPSYRHLFL